jgi:hypothetical protein
MKTSEVMKVVTWICDRCRTKHSITVKESEEEYLPSGWWRIRTDDGTLNSEYFYHYCHPCRISFINWKHEKTEEKV